MSWFLWFLAIMFGLRAFVAMTIASYKTDNKPLPEFFTKPSTNAATVGFNVILCMGVLIYGGII